MFTAGQPHTPELPPALAWPASSACQRFKSRSSAANERKRQKKEHDGNPTETHSQQREHPRGPEGRGMRGPQPLGEVADDPDGSLEDVVVLLSIRRQLLKR